MPPPTPSPVPPDHREGPLTASASKQGAVGCKREKRPVSRGVAGRAGGCMERGNGGLDIQTLGIGSPLRQGQIRGRWRILGLPLPLSLMGLAFVWW